MFNIKGKKGGELGMGLLVGAMDIATANNTVAIVMANPIAKEMSEEYGITSKNAASILDTFSCIFQGIIPYGAQMLMAGGLAGISMISIIQHLYYPFVMGICAFAAILLRFPRKYS